MVHLVREVYGNRDCAGRSLIGGQRVSISALSLIVTIVTKTIDFVIVTIIKKRENDPRICGKSIPVQDGSCWATVTYTAIGCRGKTGVQSSPCGVARFRGRVTGFASKFMAAMNRWPMGPFKSSFGSRSGGSGWIRTDGSGVPCDGETRSGDYKSPALNHSATLPHRSADVIRRHRRKTGGRDRIRTDVYGFSRPACSTPSAPGLWLTHLAWSASL
jgi:hypothetical protein